MYLYKDYIPTALKSNDSHTPLPCTTSFLAPADPVSSIDNLYQAVTVKLVHSILTQSGGGVATVKKEEEEEEWVSAVLAKLQSNAFSLYHSNQQIIGSAVHTLYVSATAL